MPSSHGPIEVPSSLRRKLLDFRSFVRKTKIAEAVLVGVAAVLLAFLTVYGVDRLGGAPRSMRWLLLVSLLALWMVLLYAIWSWMRTTRHWEQVARLLRRREPAIGDELLSVLELSRSDTEQFRSRRLCQAAIQQVAQRAEQRDFRSAAPRHYLLQVGSIAVVTLLATFALGLLYPQAFCNAFARLTIPWKTIERYTFTSVSMLPDRLIVPHGEQSLLSIELKRDSRWTPESAKAMLGRSVKLSAERTNYRYEFELPPQVAQTPIRVDVGDYHQTIEVMPKVRPELSGLMAKIALPEYLQRNDIHEVDIRSGVLSAVQGSSVVLAAESSNELDRAWIGEEVVTPNSVTFHSKPIAIHDNEFTLPLSWRDTDGLTGKSTFELDVRPFVDEPPSATAQGLPQQSVVLDSEQINFQILAADDFGIRRIGISWRGLDDALVARPAEGERVVASGGPDQTSIQTTATFCASSLGIGAQPLEVTVWAEDYLPGRPREISAAHILYVLTADEHAVWIAGQISKWQAAALEVHDVELQLHETNRRLRSDAESEIDTTEFYNALRRQASLEEANGRKLQALTQTGTELLRFAARNPEVSAEHVDQLAKMLGVLGDIGKNRMPSVADLLTQSASPSEKKNPSMPSLADVESTMEAVDSAIEPTAEKGQEAETDRAGRFGMAQTTLIGPPEAKKEDKKDSSDRAKDKLDQAIEEQAELIAEFDQVADELNAILANLEGATLVKRLKAASRQQSQVAEKIASRIESIFGRRSETLDEDRALLSNLSQVQDQCSLSIAHIMDDMQAFYDRRKVNEIQFVLDDMKASDVLVSLKRLGEDLPTEHGVSIAQAEYWADTIDRWAEDLVPPSDSSSEEQDSQSEEPTESLPPTLVLEMLRLLEGEVNLREETRVAEQASRAVELEEHEREAKRLGSQQAGLRDRTHELIKKVRELPDSQKQFAQEIDLLIAVGQVMEEARWMLDLGDTGPQSIAAETEAIELLLQTRRINPEGGSGGGGTSPGGGGSGTTSDAALALLGAGFNQNEHREHRDVGQAVGRSSERVLPEEFRNGLDEYFRRLEEHLPK